MHRSAHAFGIVHIHARRWRNERRAESDECKVDDSTDDDARKDGNDVSQQVGHERFSLEAQHPASSAVRPDSILIGADIEEVGASSIAIACNSTVRPADEGAVAIVKLTWNVAAVRRY